MQPAASIAAIISALDERALAAFGHYRSRRVIAWSYAEDLRQGPHLSLRNGGLVPQLKTAEAERLLHVLSAGLHCIPDLGLHCIPLDDFNHLVALLSRIGFDGTSGLGRLMGPVGGQCQYLVDLQDPEVWARYVALSEREPAVQQLREIAREIASTPSVGSVPGVLDVQPTPGVADERHFMIRLAKGGGYSTNGNPSDEPGESCWHVDNPKAPTAQTTGRLMVKLYAGRAAEPRVLEVRSAAACARAELVVPPGCVVYMSDLARGSSQSSCVPASYVEHRGRTPEGSWQLDLFLTCCVFDVDGQSGIGLLRDRLMALGERFAAAARESGRSTLDDLEPKT